MRQLLGDNDLDKSIEIIYPVQGSTLKGQFDLKAAATDESSVAFYADNVLIPGATKKLGIWTIENVDSTQLTDGLHTLKVTATYIDNSTESKSITVTLDNTVDSSNPTPMPTVTINSSPQRTTTSGDSTYSSYKLTIDGPTTPADDARMWVPTGVGIGDSVSLVWFFHSARMSEDAMSDYGVETSGGFTRPAGIVIDAGGAITLCINAGGTLYNNPEAERHALNAWRWVSNRYTITKVYFQGESHGGALSTWLYGNDLLYGANVRGLTVLNAVYTTDQNLWWYDPTDQSGIKAAYNNDRNAQKARNPASISSGKFSGKRVFSLVSDGDNVVPDDVHGKAFINKINGSATYAAYELHTGADGPSGEQHTRPPEANTKFMAKYQSWGGF